jgi:hypothetical protein
VLVFFVAIIYLTNSYIADKANFKLAEVKKHIVFGHSHSECALNDSLIVDLKNLSTSGESYLYTFQKLKELLKQNNQIETIFIEFSNNQITSSFDRWIWEDKHLSQNYPIYAPFMKAEEHLLLGKNNYNGFLNALSVSLKSNIESILRSRFDYSKKIGGYLHLKRNKMDSLIIDYENKPIVYNGSYNKLSKVNLGYLRKLINKCKENNIKVFLIRSPQHKYLSVLKNEKLFQKVKDSLFSDVELLDFNNFKLENHEYGDFGHLNHMGASKFSKWFDDLLKEDLLKKENKKEFVEMKLLENNL